MSATYFARQYKHSPLAGSDEIRLLILHPVGARGSENSRFEVFVDIVHEKLSDHVDYIALSYVWGDRIGGRVFVGTEDHWLPVGLNLRDALLDLRRTDRPVRLWVDALCINQGVISERNHQVQQMRRIFSSASETIVYLGSDLGGNTGLSAWNFLERQSTWALNDQGDVDFSIPSRLDDLVDFRGDISDVEIEILQRPWFRRVWVFQEVVVSKKVSLQCARRRVPWDDFCKILLLHERYHDRYGQSLSRRNKADIVHRMFQARRAYQEAHGLSSLLPPWHQQLKRYDGGGTYILNTLDRAKRLESQDPRDKVFALLGVATGVDLTHPDIAPNYGKSEQCVYTDLAAYVLETSRSYDILSYLDHGHIDMSVSSHKAWLLRLLHGLPSWVPNWNQSDWGDMHVPRSVLSTLDAESEMEQEARGAVVKRSKFRISLDAPEIVCTGLTLGMVANPGGVFHLRGSEERDFGSLRDNSPDDPNKCFQEIMGLWELHATRLWQQEMGRSDDCLEHAGINPTFDMTFPPAKGSVESHLFARARKTVNWTDDNSKSVSVIQDTESIVDGRRLGIVVISTTEGQEARKQIGLLPWAANVGDMVVLFDGARVPFLVRQLKPGHPNDNMPEALRYDGNEDEKIRQRYKKELPSSFGPVETASIVRIVGECLVDGYLDVAKNESDTIRTTYIIA